jgi:hypothetical protein
VPQITNSCWRRVRLSPVSPSVPSVTQCHPVSPVSQCPPVSWHLTCMASTRASRRRLSYDNSVNAASAPYTGTSSSPVNHVTLQPLHAALYSDWQPSPPNPTHRLGFVFQAPYSHPLLHIAALDLHIAALDGFLSPFLPHRSTPTHPVPQPDTQTPSLSILTPEASYCYRISGMAGAVPLSSRKSKIWTYNARASRSAKLSSPSSS